MMIRDKFAVFRLIRVFGLIGAVACLFSLGGCKERKEERVYRSLRGIARSKDVDTGRVSMDFTRENGHVVELEGEVTQDTEIYVDGRVATLEDVRIGEEVEVTGYITRSGEEEQMVVTQVVVTRNDPETVTTEPSPTEAGPIEAGTGEAEKTSTTGTSTTGTANVPTATSQTAAPKTQAHEP